MAKSKFDKILGMNLGLEDDDVTTTGDEEALDGSETVEGEMLEVSDAAGEVQAEADTVEDLEETHDNLEEIADGLAEASENGGLSTESAKWARLAVKAALGRSNIAMVDLAVPSMESFGGASSSRRATLSMEAGIGEMLKSFWKAIVDKMKKVFAYVKNWYMKVFDAAPKLKKRAEAIAKKSADITGAPEEKEMELALGSQLRISNKAPDAGKAIAALKDLSERTDKDLGMTTSGSYDKVFKEFDDILANVVEYKAVGKKAANLKEVYENIKGKKIAGLISELKDARKNAKKGTPVKGERFGNDVIAQIDGPSFGDKGFVEAVADLKVDSEDFSIAKFARGTFVRITDYDVKIKELDNSQNFKTLSSSEIRTICDTIGDICDHVITYRKAWENRDKQWNLVEQAASRAIASAEKDSDAAPMKSRAIKDTALGCSSYMRMGVTYESTLVNYSLAVGRSLLTWCERSLSQYKNG